MLQHFVKQNVEQNISYGVDVVALDHHQEANLPQV